MSGGEMVRRTNNLQLPQAPNAVVKKHQQAMNGSERTTAAREAMIRILQAALRRRCRRRLHTVTSTRCAETLDPFEGFQMAPWLVTLDKTSEASHSADMCHHLCGCVARAERAPAPQ